MILGLLIFFLILLPTTGQATLSSAEEIPSYQLKVSFDILASRVTGLASIQVQKEQELKIQRGDLQFLRVSVSGWSLKFPSIDRAGKKGLKKTLTRIADA
jgi:hypothetical protein